MRLCCLPKGYDSLVVGPPVRLNRIHLTHQRDVFPLSTAVCEANGSCDSTHRMLTSPTCVLTSQLLPDPAIHVSRRIHPKHRHDRRCEVDNVP